MCGTGVHSTEGGHRLVFERLRTVLQERITRGEPLTPEHAGAAAAAMLLLEVAWADHQISDDELGRTSGALTELFGLTEAQAETLVANARKEHSATVSTYPFTRIVNESMSYEEKRRLLTDCWRLANADATIDKHEEYTIRRIADLLYLSHDDFIAAKLEAKHGT